jgi:hypothetical protein
MTTPEPIWHDFEGAVPQDHPMMATYLEMHGRVACARITHYPGIALPQIEVWTERPGCEPDIPNYHYFNAFAPVRQDQTDAEWLELLATGVTTMLHPAAEPEENPAP